MPDTIFCKCMNSLMNWRNMSEKIRPDRVLILDGFNTFIRSYTMDPSLGKDGLPIGGCKGFLKSLQKEDFYQKNPLSEIHLDAVLGFTVFTLQDSLEIYYGRENLEAKQRKLTRFWKSPNFDIKRLTRIDLDAPHKVVARTLETP